MKLATSCAAPPPSQAGRVSPGGHMRRWSRFPLQRDHVSRRLSARDRPGPSTVAADMPLPVVGATVAPPVLTASPLRQGPAFVPATPGRLGGAKAAAIISPTLPLAESGPPLLRSIAGPMPSPLAVPRAAPARRRAAARSPGDLRCRPLWQPACPQCCRHDPPRPSHPPHLGGGAGKGTRPQSAVPRRRPP